MERTEDHARGRVGYRWLTEDDEGREIEREEWFPARYEVCSRCDGRGKHDPEGFSAGFTAEDFREDPDFADEYFAGAYDVQCSVCRGRNVELCVDEQRFTSAQRAAWAAVEDWYQGEAQWRAEVAAERRMGC